MLSKITKKPLSGFLAMLTLLGCFGFSEANAREQEASRYTPPTECRKDEEEPKKGLSTSDKISIGVLAVVGAAALGVTGKFIWDSNHDDGFILSSDVSSNLTEKKFLGGLPNGNNSCYMNALIQVLYHSKFFYDYINEFDFGFLYGSEDKKLPIQNSILALREIFGYMDRNTAIENRNEIDTSKKNLGHQWRQEDPSMTFAKLDILYPFLITTVNVFKVKSIPENFANEIENENLRKDANQYVIGLNKVHMNQKIRKSIEIPDAVMFYEEQITLTSVIVHKGQSANFGHYYAYCMANDGNWYKYNDSTVTQVSYEQVKREASTDGTHLVYTKASELNSCLRDAPQPL